MICPCKGCLEREIGCHGKCERYSVWKEEWNSKKEGKLPADMLINDRERKAYWKKIRLNGRKWHK